MRDRDSAFAILGLRPGAPRAEVDQAYKRLIKRHHPDYAGGDSARAAEINQAYAQLRKPPPPPPPLDPRRREVLPMPRARRGGWAVALAGLVLAGTFFFVVREDFADGDQSWENVAEDIALPRSNRSEAASLARSDGLDEPLAKALVDKSVADALRLHAVGNAGEMADFSRACIAQFRKNPTWSRFDACAAYDEAVGILETASAGFDSGAFNPSAVTARQVGAARLLSPDYLTAESRLQQIRSRVHLTLLPRIPDSGVIAPTPRPPRSASATAYGEAPRPAFRPSFPVQVRQQAAPAAQRPHRLRPRSNVAAQAGGAPAAGPAIRSAPAETKVAAPPPAAARAPREVPAWQKPLAPAWQRPLPNSKPSS